MEESRQKLRILLVGIGKTGQLIRELAPTEGFEVIQEINEENKSLLANIDNNDFDIIIDFTNPEAFLENFSLLLHFRKPMVIGTTGWYEHLPDIRQAVEDAGIGFIYASNFSIGVNVFFKLNKVLAKMMSELSEYDCSVFEEHHRKKKDAPSGTAVTLTETLLKLLPHKTRTVLPGELIARAPEENELVVSFSRYGDEKGTHKVIYSSETDKIVISHKAFSRKGFAQGALKAARWVYGKKGFFNFNKVWERIVWKS